MDEDQPSTVEQISQLHDIHPPVIYSTNFNESLLLCPFIHLSICLSQKNSRNSKFCGDITLDIRNWSGGKFKVKKLKLKVTKEQNVKIVFAHIIMIMIN